MMVRRRPWKLDAIPVMGAVMPFADHTPASTLASDEAPLEVARETVCSVGRLLTHSPTEDDGGEAACDGCEKKDGCPVAVTCSGGAQAGTPLRCGGESD
jgi:hypothetical protein